MPSPPITAAMLYDLVQCPHRPAMDLFGDPAKRDEVNATVRSYRSGLPLGSHSTGF
jgi:hypothetical protein